MTDPVSKSKGFGDAALAREVIERYAEGGAKSVWVSPEKDQNAVLKAVLTDGPYTRVMGPEISPDEREQLGDAGFSREFIETLAGPDGKRALRERVKWLGDHAVKKFWRIDPDDYDRIGWITELKNIGLDAVEALPQLLLLLQQDPSPHVKSAVVDALGEIGPTAADTIPEIVKAGDVSLFVKIRALGFIAKRPEISIPFILWAFQKDRGGDSYLFKPTSEALSNFGIIAIPYLLEGMADKNESIKDVCGDAFGHINWKEDPKTRKMVEKTAPQLLAELIAKLKSDILVFPRSDSADWIAAFANFGPMAVTAVLNFLRDDMDPSADWNLLVNSELVLAKIGATAVPPLMTLIQMKEGGILREFAFNALGKMGREAEEAAPELVRILDGGDRRAAGVLGRIGAVVSATALVADLNTAPVSGLVERFSVLENLPPVKEIYPLLLPFLEYEDMTVRAMAVRALGTQGAGQPDVPLVIAPLLSDSEEWVRGAAINALSKLAGNTPNCHVALPLLLSIRDNPSEKENLCNAAREAIQAIEEKFL